MMFAWRFRSWNLNPLFDDGTNVQFARRLCPARHQRCPCLGLSFRLNSQHSRVPFGGDLFRFAQLPRLPHREHGSGDAPDAAGRKLEQLF